MKTLFKQLRAGAIIASVGAMLIASGSTVQQATPVQTANAQENPSIVNCFDYYKFGSVQVDIESSIASTVSGIPMTFRGNIKNANNYPVVDGSVYVKIFKKQSNIKNAHINGHLLVDQFTVKENISIAANTEQDIAFDWQIPAYATTGEYKINTYFLSQKKFNLLGLSFTDDIAGNVFNFQISGELTSTLQWNKNNVTMNGAAFHFAGFIPKFKKDEPVTIKATLVNSTKQVQQVPVVWTLYAWDGQRKENIIDVKNETVRLNPNESKVVQYQVANTAFPVYFIVAEAKLNDAKSILDMRFGRSDVNRVRLNFPAITSYPLKANEKATVFSCVHNSGLAEKVDNNKMVLTLVDDKGSVIHAYTYEGQITGAMMGLKDDFVPEKDYQNFTLKAQLYTNGALVDEAEMKYDCQGINKDVCPASAASASANGGVRGMIMNIAFLIMLVALLIAVIVFVVKKKRNNAPVVNVMVLMLLLGAGMFIGGVNSVEAKSAGWTEMSAGRYGRGSESGGIANPYFTVTFEARVKNISTGALLNDGDEVRVDTQLVFENLSPIFSWVGTGFTSDSPFGYWFTNISSVFIDSSADPASFQHDGDGTFATFGAKNPTVSIEQNGTAELSCDTAGINCTVSRAGTIKPTFRYASSGIHYLFNEDYDSYSGYPAASQLIMGIPDETISYAFIAIDASADSNAPPSAPNIAGPTTGVANTSYSFGFTSTDSDGDTLKYGIDWDGDGDVDQELPSSGYVSSGEVQIGGRTWATNGTKTIRAQACDSRLECSEFSSHAMQIAEPTQLAQCAFTANPTAVAPAGMSVLSWSCQNVTACSIDNGVGSVSSVSGSKNVYPPQTTLYTLTCSAPSGGSSYPATVSVSSEIRIREVLPGE